MKTKVENLLQILSNVWSIESSTKYTKDNPALGQCGVTALVVNDVLGGDILKTELPDGWHYYNKIGEYIYDFTESQFTEKISYQNIPSSRDEALTDTNHRQYLYLKNEVLKHWNML